jgi:hypothetical protein
MRKSTDQDRHQARTPFSPTSQPEVDVNAEQNTKFDPRLADDPFGDVCTPERGVNLQTLRQALTLAVELAREGREGRKVGTMFVISDSDQVLRHSKPLILDPLYYHPPAQKRIEDDNARANERIAHEPH